MKQKFTTALLLFFSLFCGKAMAQFEYGIEEELKYDYATTNVGFSLTEVASVLECDAADLVAALDEWRGGGYPSTDIFVLECPDGAVSTEHSADYGGYYMDKDGSHGWWGSNGYWYSQLDWDSAEDKIYIKIGQNPTKPLVPGEECKCLLSVNFNGNKATFAMSLKIIVSEGIDVTPTTTIADLEIVGRTTYQHTQMPDDTWTNEPNTVKTEGIAELLGIDPEYMAEKFKYMLYAKKYVMANEAWDPELVNNFTATPSPGFWFSKGVFDEVTATESPELTHDAYGANNKFWVASLAYLPDEESVYCTIGQYPNAWTLGETRMADIYIVYGNKAYVITYELTVDVDENNPITNYNKLGTETISILRDPRDGWVVPDTFALDTTSILEKFASAGYEITADDLMLFTDDEYGNITDEYSTDSLGFWFTQSGVPTYYAGGEKNFYVEYTVDSLGTKILAIGNTPDVFSGGEECKAVMYLIYENSYYELVIDMKMKAPEFTLSTCEIFEEDYEVVLIPSASAWEIGKTDASYFEELIGTTSGILYGIASDSTLTTKYTVSEATTYGGGGFWMAPDNEDGYAFAGGYSGTSSFAMWYYNNEFTWFTVPGFRAPGQKSYATFYIANLWDGKAVKINLTIKFVDKIVSYAGSEEVLVAGRNEETGDCYERPFDMSACYDALGCTEDEFYESGSIAIYTRDEVLTSDMYDAASGHMFGADGFACADDEIPVCAVDFVDGLVRAYIYDDADVDKEFKVMLVASYGEKMYAFYVTVNTEKATAIESVKADNSDDSTIFDLSGRKVVNPVKGIYIRGGKKFLVK